MPWCFTAPLKCEQSTPSSEPYNRHSFVCQLKPREQVTPSLQQLHWLSVKQRVPHKLCTIMYSGLAPSHITELTTSVAAQTSRPRLRSADTTNYVQPRIRSKFGEQAFSHAGPAAWNSLLDELRQTLTFNSFKRNLTTNLLPLFLVNCNRYTLCN